MEKKYYITTAIDYANGEPHIGHALEKIQADVLARYHRLLGEEVFFLTGTDEHGVKVLRAAESAGQSPQAFVDQKAQSFRDLREKLDLSFDYFIRTTDREKHWPAAKLVWEKLVKAGDIYKKNYQGLYCVGHEAFVTEKDLKDGKCVDHQREPELIEEENYFFRLSKYSKEIESKIKSDELKILPESRKNEVLALLERGLEDVSFSRPYKDLPWGVPVPGDSEHTMYVWCDALTNYISAIGYGRSDSENGESNFKRWWPADAHLIGKDILRFHAAIWPGILLSIGLPLPKKILVHGHVNINGQKMSKTIGNVLNPVGLVEKFGIDPVRYYLIKEIPSGEDGDFSEEKFKTVYNGELANGLGNFSARVLGVASKIGEFSGGFDVVDKLIEEKIGLTKKTVHEKLGTFKLHEALIAINELVSFGDKYVNDNEIWKDPESKKDILLGLVVILDNVSALLSPFLPKTAETIQKSIIWTDQKTLRVEKSEALFPRLN